MTKRTNNHHLLNKSNFGWLVIRLNLINILADLIVSIASTNPSTALSFYGISSTL